MKKFFRYAAAFLALSAAFACQRETLTDETLVEEVEVTFAISTESAIATRTIGYADSYEKELLFYVYKDGQYLDQLVPEIEDFDGDGDLDAKASARLVKGQSYDFVFWAQAEGQNYYSLDPVNAVVTVDYNGLNANDESRDAFYAVLKDYPVTAGMGVESVELKRPFAQINVGTTQEDVDAAKAAGVVIDKTSVTLSNAATQFDLFAGTASGTATVEFDAALLPQQELTVYSPSEQSYYYLSMNYILVADQVAGEKDLLDTYKVTFWQGTQEINTVDIPSVPVRRNWRTNIIGENVLTDYASFEITIDPDFYGEYDYSYPDGGVDEFPYDGSGQPVDNNLYLQPNDNWTQANARFAVYFFDGNGKDGWAPMADTDKDGIYEVDKSDVLYTNIIFCRMNPSTTANNWNNKWNQTADLTIPADGTNLYTIKAGTWDNGGGTWSVK